MEIQNGKLYENKTWLYLYPCLKLYGPELMKELNSFFKLAVGIGDETHENNGDKNIYILFEENVDLFLPENKGKDYRERFNEFLNWVRCQPYYVDDYLYDDTHLKEKHMVVLKFPQSKMESYEAFKEGRYSEMYSPKEIELLFKQVTLKNKKAEKIVNDKKERIRKILKKDILYLEDFVKTVNEKFGTFVEPYHFIGAELDFPPNLEEEIFSL